MSLLKIIVAGLLAAGTAPPLARAQTGLGQSYAGQRPSYRDSGPTNPNEGLQPNGCVKLCPLDTNPCDPPEYKRADGRCTMKD